MEDSKVGFCYTLLKGEKAALHLPVVKLPNPKASRSSSSDAAWGMSILLPRIRKGTSFRCSSESKAYKLSLASANLSLSNASTKYITPCTCNSTPDSSDLGHRSLLKTPKVQTNFSPKTKQKNSHSHQTLFWSQENSNKFSIPDVVDWGGKVNTHSLAHV